MHIKDKEHAPCVVCGKCVPRERVTLSNDIIVNRKYDMGDDIYHCTYCGVLFLRPLLLGIDREVE